MALETPVALLLIKSLGTHCTEVWVGPRPIWTQVEKRISLTFTGVRTPDCLSRCYSHCWLRYRGSPGQSDKLTEKDVDETVVLMWGTVPRTAWTKWKLYRTIWVTGSNLWTCYVSRNSYSIPIDVTYTHVHQYWFFACVLASQCYTSLLQYSHNLYLICQTMCLITKQLIHNGNVSPKNCLPELTIFQSSTRSGIASN